MQLQLGGQRILKALWETTELQLGTKAAAGFARLLECLHRWRDFMDRR